MPNFKLTIDVRDVTEGDMIALADTIWSEHAAAFDASRGEFALSISRDGFQVDWSPDDARGL